MTRAGTVPAALAQPFSCCFSTYVPPLQSVNPRTGQVVRTFSASTGEDVGQAFADARASSRELRRLSPAERGAILASAADELQARKDEGVALMTSEMGKMAKEGGGEIDKCISMLRLFAERAPAWLEAPEAPAPADIGGVRARVVYEPLGVVLALMPWNFPMWQVVRALAPAAVAGNAVVLKHSEQTLGCAELLTEVFAVACKQHGAQNLLVNLRLDRTAVPGLVARADAVTYTGSTEGGRAVAAAAGAALKKCVLELGGSDAYVVLAGADLKGAAKCIFVSRMQNTGQSCIAAKRCVVEKAVAAELIAELKALFDGARQDEHYSCLVSDHAASNVRALLRDGLVNCPLGSKDATIVVDQNNGSWREPCCPGAEVAPMLIANVSPESTLFGTEIFAPVLCVTVAESHAEAIAIANSSSYGLGGAVFCGSSVGDEDRLKLAGEIQSGMVAVNDFVRSHPLLPFGGVKDSGFGRECGAHGILEFCNVKTVTMAAI